ncbi:hypothetical protein [Chryseobacterium sp.]|uniref:energy transducer TonB n=1 Tax=Chryseobacterium sp. TaxID=1871047 RepID=UPI0025C738B7|nr:hypothetical protein [Chryseobacterium sp.]
MNRKISLFLTLIFGIIISGQEVMYEKVSDLPDYEILKTKLDLSDVILKVDQLPDYPHGINALRIKFNNYLDTSHITAKNVKIKLYFIIEKNDSVNEITSTGNNPEFSAAAESALRRMKNHWTPATFNDEPVRYLLSIPVNFSSME